MTKPIDPATRQADTDQVDTHQTATGRDQPIKRRTAIAGILTALGAASLRNDKRPAPQNHSDERETPIWLGHL